MKASARRQRNDELTSCGGVVVAPGPRAAQAELVSRLDRLLSPLPQQPALLAHPVRVVVPSATLRSHLLGVLVRHRGASVAGVRVQTLLGLAHEVVRWADGPPAAVDDALLPVMVERFARREEALASALGGFEDGFSCAVAAVRDLLDAGLEAVHVEALEERLAEIGDQEAGRAGALVRVAAKAAMALAREGVVRPAVLLRRASELLRENPGRLAARACLVFGFADVTGAAGDLLETLVRCCDATVVLDLPPDPACRARLDAGVAFAARLRQRLGGTPVSGVAVGALPPPRLEAFAAADGEAEAREVARRVRALLEAGARPEGIGVVARDPSPYRDALDRQLARYAVPCSWAGIQGPWRPWAARVRGALALLRLGADTPVDAWSTAAGAPRLLPVACASLGLRRLGDLASLDVAGVLQGRGALPLPLVGGGGEEAREEVRRRCLQAEELARATRRAQETLALLSRWQEPAARLDHDGWLRRLQGVLEWGKGSEEAAAWLELLGRLAASVPASTLLLRRELSVLLERGAEEVLRHVAEGRGGVLLASVMEVRGCTFDHLFVVGCNRGVFPRRAVQDPVLPDRLRATLAPLLPDLPVKGDSFAEERYLFAQLCEASPHVTLSWRRHDCTGAALPVSPLLVRLSLPWVEAPPWEWDAAAPLHPGEAVQRAGLAGDRGVLATLWMGVLAPEDRELASGRLAILEEQDPGALRRGGGDEGWRPGPYLGLLGCAPGRERSVTVSLLEDLARCPWQTFVVRVLGVGPALDPEARVGELDGRALGVAVHRALAELLGLPEGGERGAATRLLRRPRDEELDAAAQRAAAEVAREEGWRSPAVGIVAAARVRVFLRVARELLWPPSLGEPALAAVAELSDALPVVVDGEEWTVVYRADLVEQVEGGRRLTDFKTGRNPFGPGSPATQAQAHLAAVRRGERLQAAVYAAASGGEGRLLFLQPEQDAELAREAVLTAQEAQPALAAALAVLIPLWAQGAMFPRLESAKDGREPRACQICQVREACWRGDSGVRGRLAAWAAAAAAAPGLVGSAAEAALLAGWLLPAKGTDGAGGQ